MDEQKLNKKLAEWAGFEKASSAWVEGIWKFPFDGTGHGIVDQSYQPLPDFTQSLDACFKWLVPKAVNVDGIFYIDVEFYNWGTVANVWHDRSKQLPLYEAQDKNAALALCLAIEKLIDKEPK